MTGKTHAHDISLDSALSVRFLPGDETVCLWQGWLDAPVWLGQVWAHTLSEDELSRAARFHFDRDRARFIVRHAMLRSLLGSYLGIEPVDVRFTYGAYGKPYLHPIHGGARPRFNMAHSHQLAVCVISPVCEVGIDLECVRPLPRMHQLAAQVFSVRENATWLALPPEEQLAAFYRGWTCKEAFLKARGTGLSQSPAQFSVSPASGDQACLLTSGDDAGESARWSLHLLHPAPGYVGALALGPATP